MHNKVLRRFLAPLKRTPFHPQWFVFRHGTKTKEKFGSYARGNVLDIGAGNMGLQKYVPDENLYISLDYWETAVEWYKAHPLIFGDGQMLPIKTGCMDTVFILDVLEHLPCPDRAIKEVNRVLRPEGRVIIQVPFLYPLHDSPYDFQRWTVNGLRQLACINGFTIDEETSSGRSMETAALLANIAISKTILHWKSKKNPMLLLSPLLILLVPVFNLSALLLSLFSRSDTDFMPHSIRCVWSKQQ